MGLLLDKIGHVGPAVADNAMNEAMAQSMGGMMSPAPEGTMPQQPQQPQGAVADQVQRHQPGGQPAPQPQSEETVQPGQLAKDTLIDFMKTQENGALDNGDMSKMRHESPEGGNDTIGFGHKLTDEEEKSGVVYGRDINKLTMEDADAIFEIDLQQHTKKTANVVRNMGYEWKKLSPRKKAMLVDYGYNLGPGGLAKFKKFVGAVVNDDDATARAEFTRTFKDKDGRRHSLARNKPFYETFMSQEAIAKLGR